jgi:hypothetical protein
LEIKVRVVDLDHLDAEVDDLLLHLLDIVGAQFQVCCLEEILLPECDGLVCVDNCEIEVPSEDEVILVVS